MTSTIDKSKKPGEVRILKISVSDKYAKVVGNPYRIIAVPSNYSLYKFAEVITQSFEFYFDHCFGYFNNLKNIYDSTEGYELFKDIGEETNFESVKKTKVGKVFDIIGKRMCFLFDYGDNWRFVIEVVGFESVQDIKKYPKLIELVGKSPEQYPEYDEE